MSKGNITFSLSKGAQLGDIIVSWLSIKLEKPPDFPGKTKIEMAAQGRRYTGDVEIGRAAVTVELDEHEKIKNIRVDLKIKPEATSSTINLPG